MITVTITTTIITVVDNRANGRGVALACGEFGQGTGACE